ncbi:helix-turn-helix transcriptional regulator [Longimicrobium sp.]|uniref:helix-turn-helix transcriptional regulator n=1 Tax=Longimicrobium sp. TaxID=2029185 RepID=UPI002D811354|nr:helix-turn-helix transcriptional regulator [Longimicrobium sp.]
MSQGLNLGRSGLLETILEHLTGNGYPPSSNGHDKSTGTGFWIYDIAEGMGNIGRIFLVVFKRIHSGFMVWPEMQRRFGLTQRESQVAELLLVRKSNWEIAHELGISEHTAKHHTEKILAKFGVNSRRAVEAIVRKSLLPVFVSDG